MNKKQVILSFTKLRFEIQLYMESIAKNKSYLVNQINFFLWFGIKQELS
jgi:hypothetical protein